MVTKDLMLNENLFDTFGMRGAGTVAGVKMSTSDSANHSLIEALRLPPPVMAAVEEMVKSGRIVPVYRSSGPMSYLFRKLRDSGDAMDTKALYDVEKGKVWVIMDNNEKFMMADSHELTVSVMHELNHMLFNLRHAECMQAHAQTLASFYTALHVNLLGDAASDRRANLKVAEEMHRQFDVRPTIAPDAIVRVADTMAAVWPDADKQLILRHLSFVKAFIESPMGFVRAYAGSEPMRRLRGGVMAGYAAIGDSDPDTTPMQECVFPSEPLCVHLGSTPAVHPARWPK